MQPINHFHVYKHTIVKPEMRTHSSMEQCADMLENTNNTLAHIQGVKFRTILFFCPNFDVITGFVFDYMHTINLGISAQFFKYWLGSYGVKNIKKFETQISNSLKRWHPPSELARGPRGLDQITHFKAH